MVPPRTRTALLSLLGVLALAGTAAAQNFDSAPQLSPVFRAGGSFLIDLVVGGILVAVAPAYTRDAIAEIRDDPGGSPPLGVSVAVGALVAAILSLVPILGSVILFVVDMLGLGVVGRNLVRSWT
ncbi:hypothetical protein E4P24_08285 [Haloferax sp. AS1]|uniref:hypothetical protein n=1 Tax=Haloferax sp. AS1 TaxID=2562277 RepID=UPI00165EEFDE|nr:hypothetical protein [Haloferax sp. AS1]MBC9986372.1 hypothetical protein [Haloferax sp. AS1]